MRTKVESTRVQILDMNKHIVIGLLDCTINGYTASNLHPTYLQAVPEDHLCRDTAERLVANWRGYREMLGGKVHDPAEAAGTY